MARCTVECDRCHDVVEGILQAGGTSGFYVGRGVWKRYMHDGENVICDTCMQHDPEYQRAYGRE